MTYEHPVPPKIKKKHRGLKITAAIVGGLVVLGIVIGVTGGSTPAATTAASTAPTSVCPEPSGAPTPPADGSSVAWDPYTCEWAKIPGTADVVSVAPPVTQAPEFPPQVQQARDSAQSYLGFKAFSHDGLIGQLSSKAGDGYPKDVATQAVDSLSVDWNAQAAKAAQEYLDFTSFSCSGLAGQLSAKAGDQFTKAQATFGAHQTAACR